MRTPYWKLYRLAPRSIRVVEAHSDVPAIAAHGDSLVPSAHAFMGSYSQYRTHAGTRSMEYAGGKRAAARVLARIRAWVSLVDKTFEGFPVRDFGASPEVPEDVIHDAEDLLRLVEQHPGASRPSFYEAMKADLEEALEVARREWTEAKAAAGAATAIQRRVRTDAEAFQTELVAFRRTLAAVIGRNHPDYQDLRGTLVKFSEVDDDGEEGAVAAAGDDGVGEPARDGGTTRGTGEEAAQ